jgi:hypothetical protein
MSLTRDEVAEQLQQVTDRAEQKGVKSIYYDGGPLSEGAVDEVWKDCKRCFFCNRRSIIMSCGMAHIEQGTAIAINGPNQEHGRVLYFGMCEVHKRAAEKDQELYKAKLDRMLGYALK